MPPKTRAKRCKENIFGNSENNQKIVNKVSKSTRKPLADKTNSASDDNTSVEVPKKDVVTRKQTPKITDVENDRPRRARRLPERFVQNDLLKNLANKGNEVISNSIVLTPNKNSTSFTSPIKKTENSLILKRPKRNLRLASKIGDHSVSPSRNILAKPCHSSTPITLNKSSAISKTNSQTVSKAVNATCKKNTSRLQQNLIEYYLEKGSADTNNNPKKNKQEVQKSPSQPQFTNKSLSPTKTNKVYTGKNTSFKVLETKNVKEPGDGCDIYEFTFDPALEPPVQKKKKRRTVKKKTVIFKSTYELKVAKSIQALKNVVSKNNLQKQLNMDGQSKKQIEKEQSAKNNNSNKVVNNSRKPDEINQIDNPPTVNHVNNHNSVRIEDIAAQLDPTPVNHDIDYSPVNSPIAVMPLSEDSKRAASVERVVNNDPLNLQDELSFFDDQPVANSSMNISKHPTASPWRVEYKNLPIKWNVNTYVKANMTPAFECSYIENSTKKQVYTNILSESHHLVPEPESNNTNLKQTSMTSFIRDAVNKSLNKSKNKITVTPTKQNSIFEESINTSVDHRAPSPIFDGPKDQRNIASDNSNKSTDNVCEERTTRSCKRKNEDPIKAGKHKTQRTDNDITLFGFDDSENVDQENISPEFIDKRRRRNMRPKSKAVLQELNELAGPTRAIVPVRAKLGVNSEVVNKLYEELKSAAPAPLFPEKDTEKIQQTTHFNEDSDCESDSNSVHLFEDIELVHHMKTTRKSYSKPKKVTFRQGSSSDSDDQPPQAEPDDLHDDLSDLTYHMPVEKKKSGKKKITKKQKLSKKEEKEAEQWAAQFNSMCEDVDEYDLVVE